MREMKDSGVPWIGEIPKDWETKQLKYCADPTQKNSFIDGDWIESPFIEETGIRYLTTGNIGDGYFKRQGNSHISLASFIELDCKYAYPGDLVIARLNAPFGRSCILPNDNDCYVLAVDIVILRTKEDNRFVCYVAQCDGYQKNVEDAARGTTMLRISRTNLGKIKIPLPSLTEQHRIADFLDAKSAEIDAILEKTQASIEEYKKLKQSVITEAVTKGIRGVRPMKDSGFEWIGEIPAEWEVKAIKYCFHVVSGGTPNTNVPEFWDEDIPWITPADYKTEDHYVTSGKRNLTIRGLESCNSILVPKGSVVFSKRAPIGTVAICNNELCTNQGCLACIPKKEVHSEFYFFAFTAFKEVFELYGSGTTFKEIYHRAGDLQEESHIRIRNWKERSTRLAYDTR